MSAATDKDKRKFAVFDIDGTLYRDALFHDLVRVMKARGLISPEDATKTDSAWEIYKTRAEKDAFKKFSDLHVEAFTNVMHKISRPLFNEMVQEVMTIKKNYVYTYTKNLLNSLKKQGYILVTISGSFQEMVGPFATYHGFDIAWGEVNEWGSNELFTGKSLRLTYKNKQKHLQQIIKENNLDMADSYGVGDTIADTEILEMVEHPIAFNPSDQLYNYAREHKWKIVVERKNVIYELEPENGRFILA